MELLTPDPGLLIWSFLSFTILVAVLGKYAWRPILQALKLREETIEYSLKEAEKARNELVNLEKDKKRLMEEARVERDNMLKEAKVLRDSIVEESKNLARLEAEKIAAVAKQQMESERIAAVEDLRKQVAVLSIEMAGILLKKELESPEKQQKLVEQYLKEVNFN
jgi:F-type H+-transporting ATPase subunit b